MTKLNTLSSIYGSFTKKKRVGRGIGSGNGKTAGRGHKGQKSRSGVSIKGYEGGQMPIYRRLPKRGFSAIKDEVAEVNLSKIVKAVEVGIIDSNKLIDETVLYECGVVSKKRKMVKILGQGDLNKKLEISVSDATEPAVKKIIDNGGSIVLYNNKSKINYLDELEIFKTCMNYEVFYSRRSQYAGNLSIVFGAGTEEIDRNGFELIEAVVDFPSFGVRDKILSVGKSLIRSENMTCEFNINVSKNENLEQTSQTSSIYLALFHRNRMFHKKIIPLLV